MTKYRKRDRCEARASGQDRQKGTLIPIRRQALPSRNLHRRNAYARNRGQGATYAESNERYADIGITVIMPISGLCRADVVPEDRGAISARHVGIIGLTEQAVMVRGSESNGTGLLGEACGRSARGSLAAISLPDYRGDFRSWGSTGRARCGGTIHACDPQQSS